jgi:FlaA1/EpsC-like NDP-sugar epimerase
MFKKLNNYLEKRYAPRWMVLMIDIALTSSAFLFTYLLRFNLFSQPADLQMMMVQFLSGFPFYILGLILFKPFCGIIRHSTTYDIVMVLRTQLVFSSGYFIISYFGHAFDKNLMIPWSVIIIHFLISVFLLVSFRFAVQYAYRNLLLPPNDTINVMIYGAGVLGNISKSVILKDKNIHYNILGYIDDNPQLWNGTMGGLKVYSPHNAFKKVIKQHRVQQMIFAVSPANIDIGRKREIVDQCLSHHLKVREVANPFTLLDDKFAGGQFRDLRIEDLLGREPILTKKESISSGILGKRIMVTGGAGSIGSEIVRQLVYMHPQSIIIIDQSETAVFDIQNEIKCLLEGTQLEVFVSDVTNKNKMERIFETYKPQIIFHAAAYKHVPMMEMQPNEAVSNNVGGTKNLADLAVKHKVEKFVMVSTDKAVNPTNIMGATKRICEIYIQSLSKHEGMQTQFITTRFGNVLGSNGSVIPIFKKQILSGGPVTITHRDIIRYFMTIPEACNLVLDASFLGKGGEIFIFDMGTAVRIYDMAVRMISLSGLIPHDEIKIIETGLRPGEKLYEELLVKDEEFLPTANEKIMIRKIRPYDYQSSETRINEMLYYLDDSTDWQLVARMKEIVPEFVSNNSHFEFLDSNDSYLKKANHTHLKVV